jgi:DNA-binding MarR family transcriptional regulator
MLCFLLSQVGAKASATFAGEIESLGLGPAHAGILRTIAKQTGLSQRELGDRLSIIPSRLVQLLDELEGKHLIERRALETDRRSHALHLTGKGSDAMGKLGRAAQAADEAMSQGLTKDESERLEKLLQKVAASQGLSAGVHPGYGMRWGRPK